MKYFVTFYFAVLHFSFCWGDVQSHIDEQRPTLVMCADHFPPFLVYDTPAGPPTGSLVLIAQKLTDELGYRLEFTPDTPFKRCLRMLAEGNADLAGSLLYDRERAKYLHLFRYKNHSVKNFYAAKVSDLDIREYADLKGLVIGTTLGHHYWPEFDRETSLFTKSNGNHLNDNFRRLIAGRIDLIIATEEEALFFLATNKEYQSKLKKMSFSYSNINPVYIGLSKKSQAANRHEEFALKAQQLLDNRTFETIAEEFHNNFFRPYQ